MSQELFVDHYETLQLSSNADLETIEKIFRVLAKRYHPDNKDTGNAEKFDAIVKSYQILSNPEKRAAYDVAYEKDNGHKWTIFDETSSAKGFEKDQTVQRGILSLLYIARKRDVSDAGIGIVVLERLLGCPGKYMEFHIWYLKEKGMIYTTETGQYAITAQGVDFIVENGLSMTHERLLSQPGGGEGVNTKKGNGVVPTTAHLLWDDTRQSKISQSTTEKQDQVNPEESNQ